MPDSPEGVGSNIINPTKPREIPKPESSTTLQADLQYLDHLKTAIETEPLIQPISDTEKPPPRPDREHILTSLQQLSVVDLNSLPQDAVFNHISRYHQLKLLEHQWIKSYSATMESEMENMRSPGGFTFTQLTTLDKTANLNLSLELIRQEYDALVEKQQQLNDQYTSQIEPLQELSKVAFKQIESLRIQKAKEILSAHLIPLKEVSTALANNPDLVTSILSGYKQNTIPDLIRSGLADKQLKQEDAKVFSSYLDGSVTDIADLNFNHTKLAVEIFNRLKAAEPQTITALFAALSQDAQKDLARQVLSASGLDPYGTGREVYAVLGNGMGYDSQSQTARVQVNGRLGSTPALEIAGYILESTDFNKVVGKDFSNSASRQISTELTRQALNYPKGEYTSQLALFPNPNTVRTLLLISANTENPSRYQAADGLAHLLKRPDWPQIVADLMVNSPDLQPVKDLLLSADPQQRLNLSEHIDPFALNLLRANPETEIGRAAVGVLSTSSLIDQINAGLPPDQTVKNPLSEKTPFPIRMELRSEAIKLVNHPGNMDRFFRLLDLANLVASFPEAHQTLFSNYEITERVAKGDLTSEQLRLASANLMDKPGFTGDSLLFSFVFEHFPQRFLTPDGITDLTRIMSEFSDQPAIANQMVRLVGNGELTPPQVTEISRNKQNIPASLLYIAVSFPDRYLKDPAALSELTAFTNTFGDKPQFLFLMTNDLIEGSLSPQRLEDFKTLAPVTCQLASDELMLAAVRDSRVLSTPADLIFTNRLYTRFHEGGNPAFEIYWREIRKDPDFITSRETYFQFLDRLQTKFPDILQNASFIKIFSSHRQELMALPEDKQDSYISIVSRIDSSPVQEIQRVKDQLTESLLATENPVENYEKIERIFIDNRLNLAIRYQVFDTLHPDNILSAKVDLPQTSPRLKELSPDKRKEYIFNGFFLVQLESSNPGLIKFLTTLQNSPDNLDPATTTDLNLLLAACPEKDSLPVENESLIDTFNRRVLKPVGISSVSQALEIASQAKTSAHKRGVSLLEHATEGSFRIRQGDLLKTVDSAYLETILRDGILPKELLGASAGSDATPLDTDVAKVLVTDPVATSESLIKSSIAYTDLYGDIMLVIRDRGQFNQPGTPELFKSGIHGDEHFGITVGCESPDIEFIVIPDNALTDTGKLSRIFFTIAKTGRYIPVVDMYEKPLFTENDFNKLRKSFAGIAEYDGSQLDIHRTTSDQPHYDRVQSILMDLDNTQQTTANQVSQVSSLIHEAALGLGINPVEKSQARLLDAELLDIGSTGRGTNTPGENIDFDLSLLLNANDFAKQEQLLDHLKNTFPSQEVYIDRHRPDYTVLRLTQASLPDGHITDIDIGIGKKSRLRELESHDAVADKLDSISDPQIRQEVVANIILAKQELKDRHVYKKADGGFGGIGVENWLLQNNGNFIDALQSLRQSAFSSGKLVDYRTFQNTYPLFDAGINVRENKHDDFSRVLTADGYRQLAFAADAILVSYGYPSVVVS